MISQHLLNSSVELFALLEFENSQGRRVDKLAVWNPIKSHEGKEQIAEALKTLAS